MQITIGFRHIDALVDRGDVSRAGKWPDDAAGAEDRQTAKNAQPWIHGFQRQRFAALDVDRDVEAAGITGFGGKQCQVITDHLAWHRVDCRLADTQHQSRPRYGAHAGAGIETNPRFTQQPNTRIEQRAVSHVGVVASILDRPGLGAIIGQAAELQTHLHLFAFG
ncbi:hypothetical protein D3C87_1096850 [compost metagenome]